MPPAAGPAGHMPISTTLMPLSGPDFSSCATLTLLKNLSRNLFASSPALHPSQTGSLDRPASLCTHFSAAGEHTFPTRIRKSMALIQTRARYSPVHEGGIVGLEMGYQLG